MSVSSARRLGPTLVIAAAISVALKWPILPPADAGSDGNAPKGQSSDASASKQFDAKQLADLEDKVQQLYAKVAPSVVRVLEGDDGSKGGFSGVIVGNSGEVLTCAHHFLPPRTKVIVELADGHQVKGIMLGLHRLLDVGMLRLEEKGKWPAVALGHSVGLKRGELCLSLGNPSIHRRGQPPLLRLGRVLSPGAGGKILSTCRTVQGDSGGPLFDLEGRLVGISVNFDLGKWAGTAHVGVEAFVCYRDRLLAGEEIRDVWGNFELTEESSGVMGAAHRSAVEVLGDGKPVALGLVVGADGWIATKRTELSGRGLIVCRLADGRQLAAQIVSGSREHDVALLKIDASDLLAARWGKVNVPRVGQIVASVGPAPRPLHFGVVGATRVPNPVPNSYLPVIVRPVEQGNSSSAVLVTELRKRPEFAGDDDLRELLKAGDVITHVDDVPTPTFDEFNKIRDQWLATPEALTGERLKLTVRRGEGTIQVFVPIVPTAFPQTRVVMWSLRRNGFPNVFSHDGGLARHQCGGPVVDRSGQVIGINIARADEVQTFAIPSDVVQKVVAELKAKAKKD